MYDCEGVCIIDYEQFPSLLTAPLSIIDMGVGTNAVIKKKVGILRHALSSMFYKINIGTQYLHRSVHSSITLKIKCIK
jgi:hypothetical protein